MKFGGSCLVDNKAFNKIYNITKLYEKQKKIYVASAFNGITDILLKTALQVSDAKKVDDNIAFIEKRHMDVIEQIFEEDSIYYISAKDWVDAKMAELENVFADIKEFGLEPYYQDYVLSFGEILSTFILHQYLMSKSLDSLFISANDLIVTNDEFNNAYPLYNLTNARVRTQIVPFLENPNKDTIFSVTGFVGRNKIGYITTLGRGGSDYTATILARAVYEEGSDKDVKVVLWKDIDGLLAINPKYVPNSSLIKSIDYKEAKAIANFGAKVLHPKCLEAIEKKHIPLEIRNFDKPEEEINFTKITTESDKQQIKGISAEEEGTIITLISGTMVDIPGVLGNIFKIMGKNGISVSFVAQSSTEISTSFFVKSEDSEKAIKALKDEYFGSDFFELKWDVVSIINITGLKVLENKTKAQIFNALDKKEIPVKAISQSYEELNISIVVKKDHMIDAIKAIHDEIQ